MHGPLPSSSPLPRALVRGEGGGARLIAIDAHARKLGARVSMTCAEARARVPSLATALVDDARIEALEDSIVDALLAVSPRIGRGDALLDHGRHEDHLFFVEVNSPEDVERLATVVRDLDLGPASLGIADGAFAAACAARSIEPRAGIPRRKMVRRGDDVRFLAPLPSSLLPTSPLAADALAALGLGTIALVAALPLEGVQARLGEEGRMLVSLARGAPLPALATYVPSREPSVEVDLVDGSDPSSEGATTLDAVLFALRTACTRLVPPLAARGRGIGEIEVLLEGKKRDAPVRIVVRPARAEIDPNALFELTRATVEGAAILRPSPSAPSPNIPQAFMRLRVTATLLVPIEQAGEKLPFARREASVLPLDVALARLRGRFGTDRVVTPVRHEDPRPDGRGQFRHATTARVHERIDTKATPVIDLRERLRAPSPAIGAVILSRAPVVGDPWPVRAVGTASINGPRKERRVVEEVEPPERIASGWWDSPYELVYRWVVSNDGVRALFARAAEEGGWRLIGVAD